MLRLVVLGCLGVAIPASAQARLPIAVDQRVRSGPTPQTPSPAAWPPSRQPRCKWPCDGASRPRWRCRPFVASKSVAATLRAAPASSKGAIRGAIIMAAIGAVSLGLQHETVGEDGRAWAKPCALGVWSGGLVRRIDRRRHRRRTQRATDGSKSIRCRRRPAAWAIVSSWLFLLQPARPRGSLPSRNCLRGRRIRRSARRFSSA